MKSVIKENKELIVGASSSPLTSAPDPRRWKAFSTRYFGQICSMA
jgi:hypothetical protein